VHYFLCVYQLLEAFVSHLSTPRFRHQPRGLQRPQHTGGAGTGCGQRGRPQDIRHPGLRRHEQRLLRARAGHHHRVHDDRAPRSPVGGAPRDPGLGECPAPPAGGEGLPLPAGAVPAVPVAGAGPAQCEAATGERGLPDDHGPARKWHPPAPVGPREGCGGAGLVSGGPGGSQEFVTVCGRGGVDLTGGVKTTPASFLTNRSISDWIRECIFPVWSVGSCSGHRKDVE